MTSIATWSKLSGHYRREKRVIIHPSSLQTLCKIMENQKNDWPLGFHYVRSNSNTSLFKIINPNKLRLARVNKRAMDRPIRIPRSRLDILKRLNETFASWFNILAETVILRFFNQKSGSIQLDLILTRDVQMVDLTLTRVLAQTMILCNLRLNQNMRPMNHPQ